MPTLPRVLAGPIVRRVEPTGCAIWLATSEPATATMRLYQGTRMADAVDPERTSFPTALRKFGDHLYAGVVRINFEGGSGSPSLVPGAIYSYDVTISGAFGEKTLQNEKLLQDQPAAEGRPEQLALGYLTDRLPSFVVPPATIDRLCLVHASCRKSNGGGPDALAWLDDRIEESHANDAGDRPQQLFLTGDQIYGDDLGASLLPMINALGIDLLGYEELLTIESGTQADVLPGTITNFPALRRRKLVRTSARLSSTDCDNHLLTFGEYAAMYLAAWSPRVWRPLASNDELFRPLPTSLSDMHRKLLTDWESCHLTGSGEPQEKWRKAREKVVDEERKRVEAWRDAVPRVARALANVSTLMIFDDHDVTDDWNLNKHWRNRVLRTTLGKDIIRNATMAYTVFQGWGNDPAAFEVADSPNKKALDDTATLMSHSPANPPPDTGDTSLLTRLNVLFGMSGEDSSKQVTWHYRVPGPRHLVAVLDSRTRRKYQGEGIAPPDLLGDTLNAQVPPGPLTDGRELLIVISSAPVLAPDIMGKTAAPIYELVGDYKHGAERARRRGDDPCNAGGKVTGVEDADVEAWGAHEPAREELLKRLATHKQAIILSGDVHYAYSVTLDFWTGTHATPSRIVQLTSSASRNSFNDLVEAILRSNAMLESYQRGVTPERLAWKEQAPITLPAGVSIKPGRRSRMRRSPALVTTLGWPAGATIPADKQPDWRWRMRLVRDERLESLLPLDAQQLTIESARELVFANAAGHVDAYRAVAARHHTAAMTKGFTQLRQMVFTTNIGLVALSGSGSELQLVHTILSRENELSQKGAANTVHTISLAPTTEPAPALQFGS